MIDNHADFPIILVVGDPEHLLFVRTQLEGVAGELVAASSAQQAHRLARSTPRVAVIVLDAQTPEMNDFELAKTLRRGQDTKTIPLMILNIGNPVVSLFEGYELAPVDFLIRSVSRALFQSKVQVFLELCRQRGETQKAHTQFETLSTELGRSRKALHEFTQAAAHDMKAPLRHIRSYIEMIFEDHGGGLHHEVSEWLGIVESSTQSMQNLLEALLELVDLEVAQMDFASVSLNEIVSNVIYDFGVEIGESGAIIHVPDLPSVLGDSRLLHELFRKLIGNSLKYHRQDEQPEIELRCEVDASDLRCTISVCDNGIGFEQTHADWIFMPFKRLVSSSEFRGSGIGMASAKKIVERHGGRITAFGQEGVGATFSITLPLEV